MAKSTRTVFAASAPQLAYIKAEAERLGTSPSDIIRRIIDAYRDDRQPEQRRRITEMLLSNTNEGAI